MADILIRGMEMPEGCFGCILSFMWFNGTETVLQCNVLKKLVSDDGTKDPDCPLTEIPQHGRLIDADAIPYKKIMYDEETDDFYYGVTKPYIDRMPTIIEAEGET